MTDRELMQQALEALIWTTGSDDFGDGGKAREGALKLLFPSITALRERLAQPEQEPFEYWNAVEGWVKIDEVREHFDAVGCGTIYKSAGEGRSPLYTAPPKQWVGLTDDEISYQARKEDHAVYFALGALWAEAKLREKNA